MGSIPARVTTFFPQIRNSLFTNGGACAKIIALRRAGKRAAETALFPFLWKGQSVLITMRVHPFPFRTRKLSSSVPTILGWRRPGKIGRCRHRCSSIAQSVEHAAVNRGVVGSSPTWGANGGPPHFVAAFLFSDARISRTVSAVGRAAGS